MTIATVQVSVVGGSVARLASTMTWISRTLSGLLVLVAAFALALTLFALGGAFGFYRLVIGSEFTVADMASITVAGGTLFLGAATALLTLSTRTAAAEARDDAQASRAAERALLDITFDKNLPANLSPFTAAGKTLLNSLVGSAAANAAGIKAPWAGFNALWGTNATVMQSLVPFPQYFGFNTDGELENLGQSTFNALEAMLTRRFHNGLNLMASYTWSKTLDNTVRSE